MPQSAKILIIPDELVMNKIYLIREQKVMLDFDLAKLYSTEAKRLKEVVRRNIERFSEDFMFALTEQEWIPLRTQIASLNSRRQHPKYTPFAFTEQGVAMLSSVLNSSAAKEKRKWATTMNREYSHLITSSKGGGEKILNSFQ